MQDLFNIKAKNEIKYKEFKKEFIDFVCKLREEDRIRTLGINTNANVVYEDIKNIAKVIARDIFDRRLFMIEFKDKTLDTYTSKYYTYLIDFKEYDFNGMAAKIERKLISERTGDRFKDKYKLVERFVREESLIDDKEESINDRYF